MERAEAERILRDVFIGTPGNRVEVPLKEGGTAPLTMFEAPLIGIASAADPLFDRFKAPGAVGPWFMAPAEWLAEAKSVISFFLPFTEEVKASNRAQRDIASLEWVYARVEGQLFISGYLEELVRRFVQAGFSACAPAVDPRFFKISGGRAAGTPYPGADENTYSSVWSERHIAYASGLGTFGKSRGLITARGMAGRFGSLIVSADIPADTRAYTDIYAYCIRCNACVRRCPARAIPKEGIKDNALCGAELQKSKVTFAPRYGCGLCQTGVPCESRIPGRR